MSGAEGARAAGGNPRRSFFQRQLEELGARFSILADGPLATDFGAAAAEREQARQLGLCDLSSVPRIGFKGANTAAWLAGRGVALPAQPHRLARIEDGLLACRLSPGEALLLTQPWGSSRLIKDLERAWSIESAGLYFPVPRRDSHAWLALVGARVPTMLAKICGIDFRPHKFADLTLAQTQVARTSAIVARADVECTGCWHLLFDSASAAYMWQVLIDAMSEFDGRPVGCAALAPPGSTQ